MDSLQRKINILNAPNDSMTIWLVSRCKAKDSTFYFNHIEYVYTDGKHIEIACL